MQFPIEDVVRNVRHFLTSVRRVTGNSRDPDSDRRGKASGAPGMAFPCVPRCLPNSMSSDQD